LKDLSANSQISIAIANQIGGARTSKQKNFGTSFYQLASSTEYSPVKFQIDSRRDHKEWTAETNEELESNSSSEDIKNRPNVKELISTGGIGSATNTQ
jgi:hypothetical protein